MSSYPMTFSLFATFEFTRIVIVVLLLCLRLQLLCHRQVQSAIVKRCD